MAACDLTVIIDDENKQRVAGEPVTGTVVVKVNQDVNCKALEVTSYWATHGRGNVARGDVETATLFQGMWQTGQEYRYTFKLNSATWPPTYYGNYLNVSHYIGARARVPWSTDPKTETEFTVAFADSPPDLSPTAIKKKGAGILGWLIGGVIVVLLLGLLAMVLLVLVPIFLIAAAGFWFFKIYLPKQLTGSIDLAVEPKFLKRGQTLKGTCQFTPKRSVRINGINWTVTCVEKCVSGSGSNRSTHTHEVLRKTLQLADQGTLPSGQPRKFDFTFRLPSSAPPSLKFTDNELTWSSELRIDIPKWPDWNKAIPFVVAAPSAKDPASTAGADSQTVSSDADDDPWLTEVLNQVHDSKDDPERLETVLGAIKSHVFKVNLDIQGEMDEPFDYFDESADSEDDDSESESESETENYWTAAVDSRRNARLALRWSKNPSDLHWTDGWQGSATVVGVDQDSDRIMMRVVE